jgi:tRNA modification GTPase
VRGPWQAGRTRRADFFDKDGIIDDGVIVVARGPSTYTGEDTAELTGHGNPLLVERIVAAAVDAGARLALAGEFTRRAVLHGKLDLLRAEAVLQVSQATTEAGIRVAREGLEGRLGGWTTEVRAALVDVAAELEARLDYPADELALVSDQQLVDELKQMADRCDELADSHRTGRVLVNGARVALVGAVNAGKSTLFNCLLGRSRALVHETPGTTRDVLEVTTQLDGVAITLLDTAGERPTNDPIEAAGLALARQLVDEADLLMVVLRARSGGPSDVERHILARTEDQPRVLVYNGVDRPEVDAPPAGAVATSGVTGDGVGALRRAVVSSLVGEAPGSAKLVIASTRQRDLLRTVARASRGAAESLPIAGVAVAADFVTTAVEALDALTGADTREEILDTLFARFCIGK